MYILSNQSGNSYVGITALDPAKRLIRHNKGDVVSTRKGRPWTIIATEQFSNYSKARVREREIKSWKGGNAMKKFLVKAAGSSNGRIHDSESCHLGSNPSPAATS